MPRDAGDTGSRDRSVVQLNAMLCCVRRTGCRTPCGCTTRFVMLILRADHSSVYHISTLTNRSNGRRDLPSPAGALRRQLDVRVSWGAS